MNQIDGEQFKKILQYVKSGVDSGATLVAGGDRAGSRGFYIQPTVFADVEVMQSQFTHPSPSFPQHLFMSFCRLLQDEMKIAQEEIFGPVQSILKFRFATLEFPRIPSDRDRLSTGIYTNTLRAMCSTVEEVVRRANATPYGLAAGVFTQRLDAANTLARALRVGTVWVNTYDVFDAAVPFGGYKMSGVGREKGVYSLRNYLQTKAVVTPIKDAAWL